MVTQSDTENIRAWKEEQNSAYLYTVLAEIEKDPRISEVYRRIASVELRHAKKWEDELQKAGIQVPVYKPDLRSRMLAWLGRKFGTSMILPSMQASEKNGVRGYRVNPVAQQMASEEQSHSILLHQIIRMTKGGVGGSALAQIEGRHRGAGGNALRAAVLGANDGLVSNLSLVMGVAGAALESRSILITGLAGLLAGACSMALGEWLSVQSSRELFAHQIGIEAKEIEGNPQEEVEELALIYEARGLTKEQSHSLADKIMTNPESALDTLAREELGVNPEELGGSAWEAAITSFILFAIGAIVPVLPFIFLTGTGAILTSIAISTVGLFLLGSVITLFTGKSIWFSGMRMVIFGLLAAGVTFGIGKLIGVSLAG
ncbi:MAG TPA: VIT1/CCC1 transporter family protein [Anaerolineaceae bacterium]